MPKHNALSCRVCSAYMRRLRDEMGLIQRREWEPLSVYLKKKLFPFIEKHRKHLDEHFPNGLPKPRKLKVPKPIKTEELVRNGLYLLKTGEKVVFKHIGGTGLPIFMPVGEPSFQDCFAVTKPELIVKYLRPAT